MASYENALFPVDIRILLGKGMIILNYTLSIAKEYLLLTHLGALLLPLPQVCGSKLGSF